MLTAFAVIFIAGLNGIESITFGEAASQQSGNGGGRGYQRQSGTNKFTLVLTAYSCLSVGLGIYAQLSVMTVLIIFLALSPINHAYSVIKEGNNILKNMSRPNYGGCSSASIFILHFRAIYYP